MINSTRYGQNVSAGNIYEPLVKVDIGVIKKVTKLSNEHIYYTVFLENYHQENESAEGIPIFSFGYNSYTYIEKSRVVCLIKDTDYTKVFIIGQTYDPNIIRGIGVAKQGELNISTDKNGIIGLGVGDSVKIVAGNSSITTSPEKLKLSLGNNIDLNLNPNQFNVSLNNKEGFSINNGTSILNASKGFKVFSPEGGIYLSSDAFTFTERTGDSPSYLITNSTHRLSGDEFLSLFSVYSFEVGSSNIKGKTTAVDWNILQGNYDIRLATGDLRFELSGLLNQKFKIFNGGISLFDYSQLIFERNKLQIELETSLVGRSYISLERTKLSFNLRSLTPLTFSQSIIEFFATPIDSKILFENTDSSGTKTAILEISDGNLVLTSASKNLGGKIKFDGEVEITGNLVVKGSTGIEVTTIGSDVTVTSSEGTVYLTKHRHASSTPGAPTKPLPGQ